MQTPKIFHEEEMKRGVWLAILLVCLVCLGGCATTNPNQLWYPTRAGLDFKTDKYECVQQSKTPWSGGGTGLLGLGAMVGSASSAQTQADQLFNMCMEARGYILKDKSETEKQKSNALAGVNKSKEKIKYICAKPEYAVLFVKTPCNAAEITFKHTTDNTKITPEQKTVLPKYRTEVEAVSKESTEYIRTTGHPDDILMADYIDSARAETYKQNLDLLNGVITWGEYNKYRKDLYARIQAEWKNIYRK